MKLKDLDFDFPPELIATSPQRPSRIMFVEGGQPVEIKFDDLLGRFATGDVLVLNSTKVLKRRVYAQKENGQELEILFLNQVADCEWEVLFPSKEYKLNSDIPLPLGLSMKLIQKGRPQKVQLSRNLTEDDFEKMAEIPLPPYIQKARGERHTNLQDQSWYQTAWAKAPGSLAAPTASLHFSAGDIEKIKAKGVQVVELVLHVGLGTFLPVTAEDLNEHVMHEEWVSIPKQTWEAVQSGRARNQKIWALGTTVARSLESAHLGKLNQQNGEFIGFTNLLIQPGFHWNIVDRLMTNFHQPQSTLLALVASFSELGIVKSCYQWAISKKFRLFSYGDLSVWSKN